MKEKTKTVVCKKCGFIFEVENKNSYTWMDTFEGCFTPTYCDQNQENPKNRFKMKKLEEKAYQ